MGSSGFEPQRSSQWSQRVAFRSFCSLAHWAAGSLLPALRALASAPSRLSGVLLPSLRLSLPPFFGRLVGSSGFEPPTSRLSGVRSNQLSYTPVFGCDQLSRSTLQQSEDVLTPSKPYSAFDAFQRFFFSATFSFLGLHLRKEVIQPHLPIRLPCYDFTPVIDLTFDGSLLCRLGYRLRALSTPMV